MAIYEKNYDADPRRRGDEATTNLAMLYHVQGKYELAERLYIRVISLGGEMRRDNRSSLQCWRTMPDFFKPPEEKLGEKVRRRGSSLFRST